MFLSFLIILPACERVEQLSEDYKAKHIKTTDPTPHRSYSKAQRKDYPAFDLNSLVVQEFFERLGLEKAEHLITFQQPTEEYSPWKGVPAQAEKRESNGVRPTTWAQAALTSLNSKVNVFNPADNSKGSHISTREGPYLVANSL